jgi:hypothetical protein
MRESAERARATLEAAISEAEGRCIGINLGCNQ